MSKRITTTLATALAVTLFASTNALAAHARYRIETIGQAPDDEPYQYVDSVGGLNNRGEVAYSYARTIEITPNSWRGVSDSYVQTRDGIVSVPNLGGQDARALDLTDAGLIVGGAASADSYPYEPARHYYEPFVSHSGVTLAIPTPGRGFAFAAAANEHGDVVGTTWPDQESNTAFKWNQTTGYEDLGNFGAGNVEAMDVNERGDILISIVPDEILLYGESYYYRGRETIIYNAGSTTRLPNPEYGITFADAINDAGVVVGQFHAIPGVETHAFAWDENRGLRDIGSAGEFSYATDVNSAGVVIGAFADAYQQPTTPFVYTEQDGRHPLFDLIDNPQGWSGLESATHINDRGQIAGIGVGYGGFRSRRFFLATPIPEPATALLLGLGVCLVIASNRKARRFSLPR